MSDPFSVEAISASPPFVYYAVEYAQGAPCWSGYDILARPEDARLARHALRKALHEKGMSPPNRLAFDYCLLFVRSDRALELEENLEADSAVFCFARVDRATMRRRFLRAV